MSIFKTNREKELLADRAALRKRIQELEERIADYSEQLRAIPKARTVSPEEDQQIARVRSEHETLNKEVNEIALYLRNYFSAEIARGDHTGKSISQVVKMYLGRVKSVYSVNPGESEAKQ